MSQFIKNPDKTVRIITVFTITVLLGCGLLLVVTHLKPFWVDEWRLIYNIKFKSKEALWGPLDFTQQFPRVFLQFIKRFTSFWNYSYVALRLPSFLTATAIVFFCWNLMNRIYTTGKTTRFLFVLILLSSQTFTDYLVQMKQYEMEILLSLVALWQLLELLDLRTRGVRNKTKYLALCLSFLLVPFFSYTYPIAVAPVFVVIFIQGLQGGKNKTNNYLKLQWLPLGLGIISLLAFYRIDVSQLMRDEEMHQYWAYRMLNSGSGILVNLEKLWSLFSDVGSGLLFEIIFGVLGIVSFLFGSYQYIIGRKNKEFDTQHWLLLYCSTLVIFVLVLVLAGKLPTGMPKFNEFMVPSMAILIIHFLDHVAGMAKGKKWYLGITTVLFLGLIGNVFSTVANLFTAPEYAKRINIYQSTEKAIAQAQERNIPILITAGVAYPDEITIITPFLKTLPAACVLKTFPAYSVSQNLPIYSIDKLEDAALFLQTLPSTITTAMAGDGINYQIISRK